MGASERNRTGAGTGRRVWSAGATGSIALVVALGALGGCGGESTAAAPAQGRGADRQGSDGPLVVYSGRGERLVAPLIQRFADSADVEVDVRYGDAAALLEQLLAEGTRTPADVFLAPSATALGTLSRRGLLRELPPDLVRGMPEGYAAVETLHDWVGLSGRARVLVHGPAVAAHALPSSLDGLADPGYRQRFGLAPASAGLRAQLAAYRVAAGAAALDSLLAGLRDNGRSFPDEPAVVRAVAGGEVDFGLVDHDVAWQALAGGGGGSLRIAFLREGGAAALVDPGGVGLVSADPRGLELVRFLLGADAQREIVAATGQYPVVPGVAAAEGVAPLPPRSEAAVDFADVAAVLGETERAMRRSGLLR